MMANLNKAIGMDMSELSKILDSGVIKKCMIIWVFIECGFDILILLVILNYLN